MQVDYIGMMDFGEDPAFGHDLLGLSTAENESFADDFHCVKHRVVLFADL